MIHFIILASMKGRFVTDTGNFYDNFQMMGYVQARTSIEAVTNFFDQSPYPIDWSDVEYLWAEPLANSSEIGHHGEYQRVYIESLRDPR
jgi:hypothetical protein